MRYPPTPEAAFRGVNQLWRTDLHEYEPLIRSETAQPAWNEASPAMAPPMTTVRVGLADVATVESAQRGFRPPSERGMMSSLVALAYTTAGGIVGSIATTAFTQVKDRRLARAELRKALHRILHAGAMIKDLRAELEKFQECMVDLESTALTAGAPPALVAFHQEVRYELYEISSFAQILGDDQSFPPPWYQLERDRGNLAMSAERQLQAFTWHPWRTRLALPWRLRRLRRARTSIDEQNTANWQAFEAHRAHCVKQGIARRNAQRDRAESRPERLPRPEGAEGSTGPVTSEPCG